MKCQKNLVQRGIDKYKVRQGVSKTVEQYPLSYCIGASLHTCPVWCATQPPAHRCTTLSNERLACRSSNPGRCQIINIQRESVKVYENEDLFVLAHVMEFDRLQCFACQPF